MSKLALVIIGLVGLLHASFLYTEMFNWSAMANRLMGDLVAEATSKEFDLIAATSVLAKNQGLYNGFLAAGLFWSLVIANVEWKRHVATFFLACVVVAGVYGWATTGSMTILIVQALPALIGLALVQMSKSTA